MAKAFAGLGATICDTSADLPSSPIEGLIVFQSDTNELKIYNGSSWISMLDTDAPPAMQLINPTSVQGTGVSVSNGVVSFSGTSHLYVNGVFSSAFTNYRMVLNSVGTQGGVANVRWRWRSAGADYDNSYYTRMWYQHVGAFTTAGIDNATHTEWQYAANIQNYWTVDIFNPAVNAPTGFINHHQAWGTANNLSGETHSWQYVNRVYDGFSLNPTAGSFSGTLRVYGIRDSI